MNFTEFTWLTESWHNPKMVRLPGLYYLSGNRYIPSDSKRKLIFFTTSGEVFIAMSHCISIAGYRASSVAIPLLDLSESHFEKTKLFPTIPIPLLSTETRYIQWSYKTKITNIARVATTQGKRTLHLEFT